MFDEGATFFGSLGRHSNNKEYDRSLYNTLWTTPSLYTRDTSVYQIRLEDPRFNISMATHADSTIKLLTRKFYRSDSFIVL